MRKISLLLLAGLSAFLLCSPVFADRDTATSTVYSSTQLIKTGDVKIYSLTFVATSNSASFLIKDATTYSTVTTDIEAEGSEATSGNSQFQSFFDKPLEFSTGAYLIISNGYILIRYE